MGFSFRKSIKLGKRLKLNLSKSGVGVSVGTKGARVSVNKDGIRKTVGIPGTGVYYTKQESFKNDRNKNSNNNIQLNAIPEDVSIPATPRKIKLLLFIGIGLLVIGFIQPLILIPALVVIIWDLILMMVDKKYKCAFQMQLAISNYKKNNFEGSLKHCNKALKYDEDCEGAKKLIDSMSNNALK